MHGKVIFFYTSWQGPLGWQSMADLPIGESYWPRDLDDPNISAMSWEAAIQKHIEEQLCASSSEVRRGEASSSFSVLLYIMFLCF
mgnify:CR=1 FL=1